MRSNRSFLERVTGIEPAPPAWKAGALPLSYTRVALAKGSGPHRCARWAGAVIYTSSGFFWSSARAASTSAPISTASALRNNQSRMTTIEESVP